jgi:iron-sulfur cluster assembly accessory protein
MKPSAETLQLTDRVKQKLRNLSSKHGGTAILRVDVDSGGCAGFSYKFLVESKPLSEDDILIEDGDARVVVHNMALGLINGSTLDWEEKLIGSKFYILNNPHSAGECGCKYSFTPKD